MRIFLIGAAVVAMVPAAVSAQEPMNWSGFYAGVTAGYGWSQNAETAYWPKSTYFTDFGTAIVFPASIQTKTVSAEGGLLGAVVGFNHQNSLGIVFGIEADLSCAGIGRTRTESGDSSGYWWLVGEDAEISYLATLRPRIGYAFDRMMIFGSVGLAAGHVEASAVEAWGYGSARFKANYGSYDASQTRLGWAAGAGVSYALSDSWILTVEYLRVDLGEMTVMTLTWDEGPFSRTYSATLDIVRAGVAYRF